MADLFRFGASLEKDLLDNFDRIIKKENYPNRSEAFRDLIRARKDEMEKPGECRWRNNACV